MLSDGSIMIVIRYASRMALAGGTDVISAEAALQGIRREQVKEGRMA